MKTQTINVVDLVSLLNNIKKSTIVSLEYIVDDSRSKTVDKKKQIQKRVKISSLFLNHDYTNKVRKLTGDDSFVAQELKSKTRISGTVLQADKSGEFLLDGKTLYNASEIIEFYHKGNVISKDESESLDLWTNSYYYPSEKQTAGRGLVDKEKDFSIINVSVSKILNIKISGVLYTVEK